MNIEILSEEDMNMQKIVGYNHHSVEMMFDALDVPETGISYKDARKLFIHACQATLLCTVHSILNNPKPLENAITNKVIKSINSKL